jgi:hypothetical protein
MRKLLQISFVMLFVSIVAFAANDPKLGQNYPNPAKERTNIEVQFNSPQATLTISNVLGKSIEVKQLNSPGTLSLDVTEYPEGVYFYTLEADGGKITKKMTVKK